MSYWRLFYHITFAVKNREALITEAIEAALHRTIAAKAQSLGATVYAVGGIADHLHLAVSIPPSISLAEFIGQVKGNSSHFVNHVLHPGFSFAWQSEYGVVSFGEKQLPVVAAYISNQPAHHHQNTVFKGLERTDPAQPDSRSIAESASFYEIAGDEWMGDELPDDA